MKCADSLTEMTTHIKSISIHVLNSNYLSLKKSALNSRPKITFKQFKTVV